MHLLRDPRVAELGRAKGAEAISIQEQLSFATTVANSPTTGSAGT